MHLYDRENDPWTPQDFAWLSAVERGESGLQVQRDAKLVATDAFIAGILVGMLLAVVLILLSGI